MMAGKGNPKGVGRKPGVPNKTTAAARARIEREADPIGFLTSVMQGEVIEAAPDKDGAGAVRIRPTLDQRMSAARILADKQVPNAKSRPVTLNLPPIHEAGDVLKAQAAAVEAMASGQITPDEAATIAGVLELKRRAIETVELESRIARLEQANGGAPECTH